jgi:hypothetical protein
MRPVGSRVVPPDVLAVVFLVVMGAALGCFWAAFAKRKTLRAHKRWGISGAVIDLAGTAAVFVTTKGLGWHVPSHVEPAAAWHRGLAYAATALVLLQAASGIGRWRIHTRLWVVFLPVYNATYLLAVVAYAPR